MLSIEHVRCFRRKGELVRNPCWGLSSAQAQRLLTDLAAVAIEHHGKTRGELASALGDVDVEADAQRALRGAHKLILDQCDFATREDIDPPQLRQALYRRAADVRTAAGESGCGFDRDAIVAEVAAAVGLDATTFESLLYADLDEARLVDATALRATSAEALVARWELAEIQAIVLRSERVIIDVDARPDQLRALLRSLKLFQLLFEVESSSSAGSATTGVRLVIDGPVSLFSQSTRYGLKLAMLVPRVMACRTHRLEAQVQLRKGAAAARFVVAGRAADAADAAADDLPPLVQALLDGLPAVLADINGSLRGASVGLSNEVLSVPGVGASVPDVVVVATDGRRFFVEVMGFWSRDAVWRRVAMIERGVMPPVVFCASERLRVSEAALDSDAGALLTFKGTLSPRKVAEKLQTLADRAPPSPSLSPSLSLSPAAPAPPAKTPRGAAKVKAKSVPKAPRASKVPKAAEASATPKPVRRSTAKRPPAALEP